MLKRCQVIEGLRFLGLRFGFKGMCLHFLKGLIEKMGDLEQIPLDLLHLLDVALLLRVALADLLDLASLDLDHLVLHLQLLLVVSSMDGPVSLLLAVDVAVLYQGHFFLALDHLVVLVEGYELPVVEV